MGDGTVYVSITGLQLKGRRHAVRFMWHAVRSMRQAQTAEGNLSAEARTIDGIHHTLSVWEDEGAMRRFVGGGAHRRAMKAFPAIATGMTVGFETYQVPDWSDVHEIWKTQGRAV
jgi:quinol monooxygenase YgiN